DKLVEIDYNQIRKIFLEPMVANVTEIKFGTPNNLGIIKYLAEERSFSRERIESSLIRLQKATERRGQTLEQWF
ncbi:MAG: flap structure-specific endonuclease, partial [Candidatus Nitrosotenuis sp.]